MQKENFIRAGRLLNRQAIELEGVDAAFHVHYWGVHPKHHDNPLHRHSFFEMCFVLSGEGTYTEEEKQYALSPGTLFFSRPGIWHQIRSSSGMFLVFVAFELLEDKSSQPAVHRFSRLASVQNIWKPAAEDSATAQIWRMLLNESTLYRPAAKELLRSLCYSLFCSFYPTFAGDLKEQDDSESDTNESSLLKQVKLYIEDNLSQRLTLKQAADYLHISSRHLTRLFASELGQTFSHYIQERRVQRAVELLQSTDWSVKRIAMETGFDSVHYFTRVFSDKLGVPPARFRTQHFDHPSKNRLPLNTDMS